MRGSSGGDVAVFALIAGLAGCGDGAASADGGGGPGGGGDASSGATGNQGSTSMGCTGGGTLATVYFGATVVRSPNGTPLAGVDVCPIGDTGLPCTQSDPAGEFELAIPAEAETGISLSQEGSAPIVVPIATTAGDVEDFVIGLPALAATDDFYADGNAIYPDPGQGFLAVFVTQGNTQLGFEGATVSISPDSGVGPIYATQIGEADPSLTATTAGAAARFGSVDLGTVEIVVGPGTITCDPNFGGWPSGGANSVRAPIVDGFETRVGFGCQ